MTDETMTQEEQLILTLKDIKLKIDEMNYIYGEVDNGYFYLLEMSNFINEKIKKLENIDIHKKNKVIHKKNEVIHKKNGVIHRKNGVIHKEKKT